MFYEVMFRNNSCTEIDMINISTNFKKDTSLIEYNKCKDVVENGGRTFGAWVRKDYIKPNQVFKIRVYYLKDCLLYSNSEVALTIYLKDINGRYWRQNFDPISNKVGGSEKTDRTEMVNNFRGRL